MLFHKKKFPLRSAFAFLPWLTFWSQGGSKLPDYTHVKIAVARDAQCKSIVRQYRTTIVRTLESRAKGLSGRRAPLASDEAMLFVFEPPQGVSFWMKDTLIPLEIAFFDPRAKLAQILEMPVEANPAQPIARYNSTGDAIAALELEPSSLKKAKITTGELCVESNAQ